MSSGGGLSELSQADPDVQAHSDSVKGHAEQKSGKKFVKFVAVSYKTQVVAGTNYFIKVHVGGDDYVHLRVFQPLPHTGAPLSLDGLQENKTKEDPIEYF